MKKNHNSVSSLLKGRILSVYIATQFLLKIVPCTFVVPQFPQIVTYYRRAGFVTNALVLSNDLCLNKQQPTGKCENGVAEMQCEFSGLICGYLKKLCKLGMYANRTEKMARSLCRYKYFIHIFLEIMHLILSEV